MTTYSRRSLNFGCEVIKGVLYPPPVVPGDTLRIVAPSGPFDKTLFYRALGWLGQRYHLIWSRGALERQGYLAGDDHRRLAELNEALCDPTARAIIAVRGGYGLTRICHTANVPALLSHPKWCVGFSDFTALHLEAMQAGIASLHASNLAALGRADEVARSEWLDALERPLARRTFSGLEPLRRGQCRGVLVGGNLTLLFTAAASGRLRLPDGCLLFFEEVNEAPYRIDRMLTALRTSGQLARVAGFCAGDLVDDDKPAARRAAGAVLLDCLGGLGVPLAMGLPVGHGRLNAPLPLGLPAHLDADLGVLRVGTDAVDAPRHRVALVP
jgi:muramoyltetrapeptide carboxypeptidase